MPSTNDVIKGFFDTETYYGGGKNGAKYSKTHPAADDMIRYNIIVGDLKIKPNDYIRTRYNLGTGGTLGKGVVFTTGRDDPDVEVSYLLQTAVDPLLAGAFSGNKGPSGTTYYNQWVLPDPTEVAASRILNLFGLKIKSYMVKGSFDGKTPPLVTVKFDCYDMEVNTGTVQTAAEPGGKVNIFEDTSLTLDSDLMNELISYELIIEKILNPIKVQLVKYEPHIQDMMFKLTVDFNKDEAGLMDDKITQLINLFPVIWTDGTNTLTVTNCYVDKDNSYEYKMDDFHKVSHKLNLLSEQAVFS